MRKRWKVLGGASITSVLVGTLILGRSGAVQGDTTSDPATPAVQPEPGLGLYPPPNAAYSLGPDTIPYDQLSAADKAAVDVIQETVETSQPASYQADIEEAFISLRQQMKAELAARNVGLVGTAEDGVVP